MYEGKFDRHEVREFALQGETGENEDIFAIFGYNTFYEKIILLFAPSLLFFPGLPQLQAI